MFMIIIVYGCARTPVGVTPISVRELSIHTTFAGPINDNYYYYFPIDTTGGGTGPVPVFPGISGNQDWITGSADYYIQYHQRQYTVYKIVNLQPLQFEQMGSPLRYTLPSNNSKSLDFTIDLNTINAANTSIDVNIIAVDQPLSNTRMIDALGLHGSDFLNAGITYSRSYTNAELSIESINDILDNNGSITATTDQTAPLDIADWSISVNI
jgi:hypothetical protein